MLMQILLAAASASVASPVVSNVIASTDTAGSCASGDSASVAITWTASAFDTALFRTEVYKDGVLFATPSVVGVSDAVTGYVEGGLYARFTSAVVYRVDVVRISDNVVVSTATAPAWVQLYGRCSGLGG